MVADSRVIAPAEANAPSSRRMVVRPSEALRGAMKPTRLVLFLRTSLLYQLWRFVIINVRMVKMIIKSHG
jgi:hypothetical protein